MSAGPPQRRILAGLLREARPLRLHISGIFLLEFLSVPLALFTPVPLKIAIDSGIGHHPLPGPIGALVPSSIACTHAGALAVAVAMLVFVGVLDHGRGVVSWVLGTCTGERLTLLEALLAGLIAAIAIAIVMSSSGGAATHRPRRHAATNTVAYAAPVATDPPSAAQIRRGPNGMSGPADRLG